MRRIRGQEAIRTEFASLDYDLDGQITTYLMGGGAMTFRGLKNGTRDLDLLVESRSDFDRLRELLYNRGYENVQNPVDEYASLGAALMLDKDGECRFDIFDREVIRKLRLSDGMKDRAEDVFAGSSLRIRALSNEDIFLFKGVAGRSRDPDDMARMVQAGRGLNFDVIANELREQLPLNTGSIEWELFMEGPKNHPVIAFERALLSLPMTLPNAFTTVVEEEADRVYAEFELLKGITGSATINELTETLTSRDTVAVSSRTDVVTVVESLIEKISLFARETQ
jgi:hypothetical protein